MLRYTGLLSTCRTKNDVKEQLDLSPKKEKFLGSLSIMLASVDTGFLDLYSRKIHIFFNEKFDLIKTTSPRILYSICRPIFFLFQFIGFSRMAIIIYLRRP